VARPAADIEDASARTLICKALEQLAIELFAGELVEESLGVALGHSVVAGPEFSSFHGLNYGANRPGGNVA
jgi:hypothetical protein